MNHGMNMDEMDEWMMYDDADAAATATSSSSSSPSPPPPPHPPSCCCCFLLLAACFLLLVVLLPAAPPFLSLAPLRPRPWEARFARPAQGIRTCRGLAKGGGYGASPWDLAPGRLDLLALREEFPPVGGLPKGVGGDADPN